ncbi:MAG: hypothetical protein QXK28_06470 [Sulfolobales archaeon]
MVTGVDSGHGKVLLIAGYGGHSGYVFAIVYELSRMGFKDSIILVPEGYEFLADKFKPHGRIRFQVLPRKPAEPLYSGLHRWVKAFLQSINLVLNHRISIVFAGGSNFSLTPSIIAKTFRNSKVYTIEAIEHFITPSRAVKILESVGGTVFLHWEEQLNIFPKGVVVGPVYEPPIYEVRDEGYVLVTTGTLGYKELFDIIERLGFEKVVLQSGDIDPQPYLRRNPSWIGFKYSSDIHRWIANASLVITQQGLTASIARLAYRKPTVIVWNPRVTLGAKKQDVRIYAEKLETPLVEDVKIKTIRDAVENVKPLTKTYPNGSYEIANILINSLTHHT